MTEKQAIVRKMTGEWNRTPKWEGMRSRVYPTGNQYAEVTENWLIGKKEGAENFAVRYYHIGAGGFSRKEHHAYDHGVIILHGKGEVLIGEEKKPFSQGDVIYIPPDIEHQLINTGKEPMGFLCIIPAKRKKNGQIVWADENIKFDNQ
ncbi:MAG: cupin domain-containing protein [Anaerolineales bacterium]|nr:cupin domain-containing protein [Anaerolineales bacterium]